MTATDPQVPTWTPPRMQDLIRQLDLTEQADPNPTPRAGERPIHTTAVRLWTGGRTFADGAYIDDGYSFIEQIVTRFGWKPNPHYGDWPMVVEFLRVHDPKDDPDESGRFFRWYRLTYVEGGVYLAEYHEIDAARKDAWQPEEW